MVPQAFKDCENDTIGSHKTIKTHGNSPIFKNDDEIEAVWKKQYPLAEFSAESNFKSYDELKKRLDTVLAGTTTVGNVTTLMEDESIVSTATVDTKEEPAPTPTVTEDDEVDTMSYF